MYLIDVDLDLVVSIDELSKIVCIWANCLHMGLFRSGF